MTDIFTVRTEPPRGNSFCWRVDSLAGDIGRVNESPAFAMQIIMDAWQEGTPRGSDLVSPETAAEFKELFEILTGRQVPTDPDGFLLAEDESVSEPRISAREFYGDRIIGEGTRRGRPYVALKGDAAAFKRRIDVIITGHKVLDNGPEAAYFESTVVDARYLAHLANSVYFRTAFTGHLPYDY
ncbi:hypothetical protein [Glycomyces tenuis]|uniref:hypothetical protein n=1 Tax=Glycomyces tenuis TaxID=58116 RepID=UPI000427046C|nr:hypothetical protein [Glycomyces tenuis]